MKRCLLFNLFVMIFNMALGQHYKYIDSSKVMGLKSYQQEIKEHPDSRLVEIKKYIPEIVLDIRYATTNNFTHHRMYPQARAFARLPVVMALKDVEADLKTRGLGLKIYDAYRPYTITEKFYEVTPDTNFVADPRKGSKHNRGCAIDLSLVDLKTGKELDMPTGFDGFSRKAGANYPDLPQQKIVNRELLKSVMQAHGFKVIATEWWHYDFNGWANYPLLDIPFSAI
ncbi:M15 family metallopeptidase [Mucilaginibacter sp. OK098]|uniref:M15 family metallopeptidase n=1 Tax=Mucilaginibacter sp. OK098 TaxID=1855297 RepID=UPI00093248EF|nr:M15 family metallopeptidase [Mucilaginibacter sp. OK098]